MDADGAKTGYDIELTRAVSEAVRIPVIASGGAGSLDHMVDVLVEGKECELTRECTAPVYANTFQ